MVEGCRVPEAEFRNEEVGRVQVMYYRTENRKFDSEFKFKLVYVWGYVFLGWKA